MKKRIALNISIVIYAVVLLLGGYGSMQCEASEPLMPDQSIARYKIEDLGKNGTLFPYGTEVEVNIKVGLWIGEDWDFPRDLYLVIYWPNEKHPEKEYKKKIRLDETYCLDGVWNYSDDSDQWKDVTCTLKMRKNSIPDEGKFRIVFQDYSSEYESDGTGSLFSVVDRNYMRFEKTEEGIVLYSYEADDL